MSDPDLTNFIKQQARRSPLLTADEEILLARQVQAMVTIQARPLPERSPNWEQTVNQGQQARAKMVTANLRLVIKVAGKYVNKGLDFPDLIQEGNLGLIRGIEKYDPERGYKLSTYCYWWIRQGIARALRDKGRTIRIPSHTIEELNQARRVQRQLQQELERTPTVAEVAQAVGISETKLKALLTCLSSCTSLDAKISGSMNEEVVLGELIADTSSHRVETVFASLQQQHIEAMLKDLNPKEQFVIRCRFGFETGETMSLPAIARRLGISGERVRQIQNKALNKLKTQFDQSGGLELLAG